MNKFLWVTSFNQELYDASGRSLLLSYQFTKSEGDLVIGYDGNGLVMTPSHFHVQGWLWNKLDNSTWLHQWLERNKDISPPKPCSCKDPWARKEAEHTLNCPHTWFNRNTYRWIRKIATIYEVLQWLETGKESYKYMCWVDCDCRFTSKFTFHLLDSLFKRGKIDLIYLKGTQRKVMEAGFVGYNLQSPYTHNFLLSLFNYYMSGSFRELVRWDDSYVIQKLMKQNTDLVTRDIATTMSDQHAGVFKNSRIGHVLAHDKGTHGRQLGIMK